jgi:hypothetical protein
MKSLRGFRLLACTAREVKATQLDGGAGTGTQSLSADSDNIPCYVLVHVYSFFFNNTLA